MEVSSNDFIDLWMLLKNLDESSSKKETSSHAKKTPPAGVPKWFTQASGSPAYDTLASQSDLELDNTSEDSDS